jgi:hypothetical protein
MELDLSLENKEIYAGVKIESYGGKKSFELNQDNLNLIGENIAGYIKKAKAEAKASGGRNDKNPPRRFRRPDNTDGGHRDSCLFNGLSRRRA